MPAHLFTDLIDQGANAGHFPGKNQEAKLWFRRKALGLGKQNENVIMRESRDRHKNRFYVGNMYFFMYDPKHKKTLPYYDTFPLIFPIHDYGDRILGLNFHYLQYKYRGRLMDLLYEHVSNDKFDEKTKMKATYKILMASSKNKFVKPTIKMYLKSHIRSKLIYVHPQEWDIAIWLNVARFEKARQNQVWADSRQSMGYKG